MKFYFVIFLSDDIRAKMILGLESEGESVDLIFYYIFFVIFEKGTHGL